MSWGLIAEMGFITIQTTKLDEQIAMTKELLGLREVTREGNAAYFAASDVHHEIVYIAGEKDGIDHLSLRARDSDALKEIRRRVKEAGMPIISDGPLGAGIGEAFSFHGPEGYIFEIYTEMFRVWNPARSDGPDHYGHINMHPTDVVRMKDFFVDILDFRVSDIVGTEFAYFLRCNSEHHGVALIKGRGSLHHHAWETQSVADLGRLADRVDRMGKKLLWGPVRHGAGHNIAAYYEEPTGAVVELYCDMEQILDDDREPNVWPGGDDLGWVNRWMDYRPMDFRDYGAFPLDRPANH